jgi:hypothetical protein
VSGDGANGRAKLLVGLANDGPLIRASRRTLPPAIPGSPSSPTRRSRSDLPLGDGTRRDAPGRADAGRADGSGRAAHEAITGGAWLHSHGAASRPEGSREGGKLGGDGCGIVSSRGGWTVPRMVRRGILGNGRRPSDENATTSEAACLTVVRCLKPEYPLRIGEVRGVEQGLTSSRRCKAWVRDETYHARRPGASSQVVGHLSRLRTA